MTVFDLIPDLTRAQLGDEVRKALAEAVGKAANRAAQLGLACDLEVAASCELRLRVPALPDPVACAHVKATLTWRDGATCLTVTDADVDAHLVPEGAP